MNYFVCQTPWHYYVALNLSVRGKKIIVFGDKLAENTNIVKVCDHLAKDVYHLWLPKNIPANSFVNKIRKSVLYISNLRKYFRDIYPERLYVFYNFKWLPIIKKMFPELKIILLEDGIGTYKLVAKKLASFEASAGVRQFIHQVTSGFFSEIYLSQPELVLSSYEKVGSSIIKKLDLAQFGKKAGKASNVSLTEKEKFETSEVIFFDQCLSYDGLLTFNDEEKLFKNLLQAFANSGYKVLIKLHPRDVQWKRKFVREFTRLCYSDGEYPFEELIFQRHVNLNGKIFITYYSSIIFRLIQSGVSGMYFLLDIRDKINKKHFSVVNESYLFYDEIFRKTERNMRIVKKIEDALIENRSTKIYFSTPS
ncbi:MAG: hypothetical protein PWP21_1500 [Thermosediminibacterales bacterium]|nr:hypothetical protein [Thermosediminibacterales bacterium]